ncbi:MAG: efflux RND transporter permease subunit, partial [Candidatus Latescibacterota bacterium]|nr:efflux RND transporter permease subunit [Candidatus Latescibacterota bacterium]
MERRYVTPMEAAAARGRGVERVVSIVQTGRAQVTVQYGWAADMDEAYLDLQKAMADFGQRNDESTITVSQQDPNAVPVIVAAFYHPDSDDPDALRQTAESIIRNELIRLPGVAAVELVGARQMEVEILVDALTLEAFGLTVETVAGAVQRANRNLAGGSITEMGRRYVIRGVGEFESVAEIEDVIVGYSKPDASVETRTPSDPNSGEPIRLHQVATVRQALAPATNLVRLDGRRCLGLEIYKEARSNTISSAASIREQLDLLRRTLPGYELIVIQDQSHFVEAAVQEVQGTGLAGVLLAVVVLFLFLRRVGVTLVVSLAIPVSVVATFNLMYFGDLTLNLMT